MEEILEALLNDLDFKMGDHRPGDCRVSTDGYCYVCNLLDMVIEAVRRAEDRMERVRCGLPVVT